MLFRSETVRSGSRPGREPDRTVSGVPPGDSADAATGRGKHCQHGLGGGFAWWSRWHPIYSLQARRRGFDESIAFHYGDQGIRCNAVCPGSVETAIGLGGGSPHQAGLVKVMPLLQHTPAARIARPEHIASVIAFLASNEASNVNGAILPADYGWSAV